MIQRPRTLAAALAAAALIAASGCQSTQDKAKEVQAEGAALVASQKPLAIPKQNPDVKVLGTTLLSDENGSAVVVQLQNTGKETQVGVPILVDVRDAKGKSVFRNDAFGLDFALNHVPVIEPGQTVYWVNDQVLATGDVKSAKVKVGLPEGEAPAELPEIDVQNPNLRSDPSGTQAEGNVENKSNVDQHQLILFAVATRGGRVVAAGRGALKKLLAGSKPGHYIIFFIGDPTGADVTVTAPPAEVG